MLLLSSIANAFRVPFSNYQDIICKYLLPLHFCLLLNYFYHSLQYVNADRQRQLECLTSKEHQLQTHPSISSVSSVCGPHMVSGSNKALSRCTEMPTSNHSTCHLYEAKNTESETSAANIPQTGDPAQDMLDLLLGPLLKKPKSEEHETATFAKEHIALSYTTIKPSTTRKEIWKNDAVLTKKKSSLRDKVAMLLD